MIEQFPPAVRVINPKIEFFFFLEAGSSRQRPVNNPATVSRISPPWQRYCEAKNTKPSTSLKSLMRGQLLSPSVCPARARTAAGPVSAARARVGL